MVYNDLSLSERAQIIHMGVQVGLKSLSDIRSFYDNAVNEYTEGGGIHISPSKRGTFTAAATKHGKSVQEFASQVLAHKENYSPAMVKKATFARNFGGHRHEDGGSNWLPDFAYNPSIQSDNGRQLVQSVLQDQNIQRAVQQKALQRQVEIEAQRKAVSEIYNGMPNPGAGYVSGADPLLQAVVDMTPAGDAEMATEVISELGQGNLKTAGLLTAGLLLPNMFNKSIRKAIGRYGKKTLDFSDNTFNKDILNEINTRQYQDYLSTGNLWDESLTPIPQEHLGTTIKSFPEDVVAEFENSVYPRMVANRPWVNSEDLIRNARTRIGNEYSVFPGATFDKADLEKVGGIYYPSTDRIAIREGYIDFALPHEVRHKLDNGIELTEAENNILEKAFGKEFIEMQGQKTRDMWDEMITTNLDARRKLLGKEHTTKTSIQLQNKIIDAMPDGRVVKAIREADGYGKELISILEKQDKLTPERINAFREAMKKVGIVAVPIAGISSAAANNQKSTGGPLYPFSFTKAPLPRVRY